MASTKLRVGDGAVLGLVGRDARLGVGVFFAAQTHDQVRDGLAQARVFGRIALLDGREVLRTVLFQDGCFGN